MELPGSLGKLQRSMAKNHQKLSWSHPVWGWDSAPRIWTVSRDLMDDWNSDVSTKAIRSLSIGYTLGTGFTMAHWVREPTISMVIVHGYARFTAEYLIFKHPIQSYEIPCYCWTFWTIPDQNVQEISRFPSFIEAPVDAHGVAQGPRASPTGAQGTGHRSMPRAVRVMDSLPQLGGAACSRGKYQRKKMAYIIYYKI